MATLQELYDDAMFDFSRSDFDGAITKLKSILEQDPSFFDAQLSLGMAYYRKGEEKRATEELGIWRRAHTNCSVSNQERQPE